MDITTLFKAYVKTVKTTNKNLGINNKMTPILKTSTNRDIHLSKAKDVVKQITNFQNFLIDNKPAYLNIRNYLSSNKTMTEADREKIDLIAESIVKSCKTHIIEYHKYIDTVRDLSEQRKEHYNRIIESLELYLKIVSKIYTEAKAVRIKRVIDTHKLSKLETPSNKHKSEVPSNSEVNKSSLEIKENRRKLVSHTAKVSSPSNCENELNSEDMQMFESENELLFQELNSISDEVQQIESKVVHIAELQDLFTEKVLQQDMDINRISENVVGSNENLKEANEQIRQALQRNAGFRAWILFILLVMSFSLLFLDWYNP